MRNCENKLFTIRILSILLLVIGIFFSGSSARGDSFVHGKMQAAYIYNFIKFTTWINNPEINNNEIKICLFGEDNITDNLNNLNGKIVQRKKIVIDISNTETTLEKCHVLYISPAMYRKYKYLLDLVSGKPVLTVGNDTRLLKAGGIISLKELDGKQRFEVNIDALEQSKLDISSKLLALAIIENHYHD